MTYGKRLLTECQAADIGEAPPPCRCIGDLRAVVLDPPRAIERRESKRNEFLEGKLLLDPLDGGKGERVIVAPILCLRAKALLRNA